MKKGQLFIFSGPSGVGKGTITKKLLEIPKLNLVYSISMTTRRKRVDEIEGKDYFFVKEKTFKKAIKNNELIEYVVFIGNYYGTPWSYCLEQLQQGYNIWLEIDVQGATQIIEKIKERNESVPETEKFLCHSIFLIPPSIEELKNRIKKRGTEPDNIIYQRIIKASLEIEMQKNYDYVISNHDVEKAFQEVYDLVASLVL